MSTTRAVVLTMRVTAAMRDRIEGAAKVHGRSLSQELERRIQNSFLGDRSLGGEIQGDLLRDITLVMDAASTVAGSPWFEDQVGWRLVNDAVRFLVEAHEPPSSALRSGSMSEEGKRRLERWRQETELTHEQALDRSRELAQLRFKKTAHYLEPVEEMRLELLELAAEATPELANPLKPNLADGDLALWEQEEEDRVRGARMWKRVEGILTDAAKRSDNRGKTAT